MKYVIIPSLGSAYYRDEEDNLCCIPLSQSPHNTIIFSDDQEDSCIVEYWEDRIEEKHLVESLLPTRQI